MDIEGADSCLYDALDIYDGSTKTAPLIGRFCGRAVPEHQLRGATSNLLLHFHSDGSLAGAGFWLHFNLSEPVVPECSNTQPVILQGSSGTVMADVNPSAQLFQDVTQCHWKIIVSRRKVRNYRRDKYVT